MFSDPRGFIDKWGKTLMNIVTKTDAYNYFTRKMQESSRIITAQCSHGVDIVNK